MLRLAFDFIITWRETRTRPNAYRRQTNRAYSQKADYKKIKFCFHFNNCLNGTLIEI